MMQYLFVKKMKIKKKIPQYSYKIVNECVFV